MQASSGTSDVEDLGHVRRFLSVVRAVRKTAPRMELGQANVLFYVLSNPGSTVEEIAKGCGSEDVGSVKKTLRALADTSNPRDSGSGRGLIYGAASRTRRASETYFPTERGYNLAHMVAELLEPGSRPG